MEHITKVTLLIDADNAPAAKIDVILAEAAKYGVVNIRRAYGNWKSPQLQQWEDKLHEHGIQPIQQFDLTKGKNATDMALIIDAMDILYNKNVDTFCIVSSDCDFTPLVTRILADGKAVVGFGQNKAPKAFVNSCSKFLMLDDPEDKATKSDKPKAHLKRDTKLMNLLRQAVASCEDDSGWAPLGPIGNHISNHASFDHRNYGFSKLSELIKAIDSFEVKTAKNSGIYVRLKKKKHQ